MWKNREIIALLWLAILTALYGYDKFGTMRVRTVRANSIEVADFRGETAILLSAFGASDDVPKSWPRIQMHGEESSAVTLGIDAGHAPELRITNFGDMEYAEFSPDGLNLAATKNPVGAPARYFCPRYAIWTNPGVDVRMDLEGKQTTLSEKTASN